MAHGSDRAGRIGDQCGYRSGNLVAHALVIPGGNRADSKSGNTDPVPVGSCSPVAAADTSSRRAEPAERDTSGTTAAEQRDNRSSGRVAAVSASTFGHARSGRGIARHSGSTECSTADSRNQRTAARVHHRVKELPPVAVCQRQPGGNASTRSAIHGAAIRGAVGCQTTESRGVSSPDFRRPRDTASDERQCDNGAIVSGWVRDDVRAAAVCIDDRRDSTRFGGSIGSACFGSRPGHLCSESRCDPANSATQRSNRSSCVARIRGGPCFGQRSDSARGLGFEPADRDASVRRRSGNSIVAASKRIS